MSRHSAQQRHGLPALARAGEQYHSFFAANPHPAFWIDRDGTYLAANPAGARLSGYSEEELCSMSFTDVLHPDDLPQVVAAFGDVLEGRPRHVDARLLHRDGRVFDLVVSAVPVAEGGEVVGVHGVAEDVTERNESRRRLAESQAALVAATAEARQVKSTFLANVNHEVRTPLTTLLGYLELLTETGLDPAQETFVGTISRSGERLLRLVDELLDFSALDTGAVSLRAEPLDVRRVVAEAVASAAPCAEGAGIELRHDCAAGVPERVLGDEPRLRQLLGALVDNAVNFTDEGHVALTVTPTVAPTVALADDDRAPDDNREGPAEGPGRPKRPERRWLRFTVRDTGIGIPEEQRAQLFEPFTQGDMTMTRRHGGAGLGLAVCRRIVDLMDGTIAVESSPGGSVFTLDLPFPSESATP